MNRSSKLKTALIAVGGSLAAVPVAALELGDVKVHSTLGQPLRASIAYALAPNEAIADSCVSLVATPSASGMPTVGRASMIVADGVIAITGQAPVQEPLLSMRVNIRCPYTPQLTREYMLFVDPADMEPQPVAASVRAAEPAPVAEPAPAPRVVARISVPRNTTPVAVAARYRVQPGDSLSQIAERIEDRPVGLWPAVNAIFAANPDAFIDNDMNKLKAGSWLDIPDLGTGASLTVADAPDAAAAPAEAPATTTAYEPVDVQPAAAATPAPVTPAASTTSAIESVDAGVQQSPTAQLQPGDVILDSDNPLVAPAGSDGDEEIVNSDTLIVIPDTLIDGPTATSSNPNVPAAVVRVPERAGTSSPTWLWWILGGAATLIASLLLFRRFGGRFGSTPIGPEAAVPQRRRGDSDTQRIETLGDVDIEVDIADDSPTAENLALDADLFVGTGLQDGTDVEVAPEFAFASTTSLDLELPEEMSSGEGPHTDIIPPLNLDPDSILESEVLPDDDDDYDMSVIVDATQMPDPTEVTERDLEAIAVPDDDETLITNEYTVSHEVDYKILEQDYEDEFTATQALNKEIQKAAEELASRMDEGDDSEDTKEMSLATVHELDVTAQLRGKNDDMIADDDDTGVNPTVELEADDKTVEMDDSTLEMPKDGKQAG